MTLRQLCTQIACAFAEEFFGFRGPDGRMRVPLDQAAVIAAGRLDLWSDWADQPEDTQRMVGQFLRLRHNELGSPRRFLEAARGLRSNPTGSYHVPDNMPDNAITYVVARHGQQPLDLAERLLEEAERTYRQARAPLPAAESGRWSFGWRGESVVELPVTIRNAQIAPVVVDTAPALPSFKVDLADLQDLADELGRADTTTWRTPLIAELFDKLRDAADLPVTELMLLAGGIQLLNAPTGVGKTVLTHLLAIHLKRQGIPVAIVVGIIDDAASTAEKIEQEIAAAHQLAAAIQGSLQTLQIEGSCVALVSPRRLQEKATTAADRDDWDRFDKLAYGCALTSLVVDGPPPEPGEEPCTSLKRQQEPASGRRAARRGRDEEPDRFACPYLSACGRHRGFHEAAKADILVTNHHNLISGTVPVPVRIDGLEYNRMSVLEFLMRLFPALVIDEVDLMQSIMFDVGASHLVLASRGGFQELPLTQLDNQRTMLLATEDREVLPPLSRTRFLADQFLNYVLENDIWLEDDPDRPGSGWHVPNSKDRMLILALFGIDKADEDVPIEVYEQFNALFPDTREENGGPLPRRMRTVARLLRSVISNDTGRDRLREIKNELHQSLRRRVRNRDQRRDVVNALLIRTWLGALQQSLTRLTFAASSPGTDLPAARVIAEETRQLRPARHDPIRAAGLPAVRVPGRQGHRTAPAGQFVGAGDRR